MNMNGHSIDIKVDNGRELTLFKVAAGATLIINADPDDDCMIRYDGYMSDDCAAGKLRNVFEVQGTLVNNGADITAGRSKKVWMTAWNCHGWLRTGYAYKQISGNAVYVTGSGVFVMNSGRVATALHINGR